MRKSVFAALAAGAILVAAGFTTAAISAPSAASAQESAENDGDTEGRLGILDGVLSELVDEGVIDDNQAAAILGAVEERREEIIEEKMAERELLRELFTDGVLTRDEASQLPDDHYLLSEDFDEAWEDGELTRDEIPRHPRFKRGFRHGFRFGSMFSEAAEDGIGANELAALVAELA